MEGKTLYRIDEGSVLAGVCNGIAHYFEVDVNVVRIICVMLMCLGIGVVGYLVGWLILPKRIR